VTLQLEVTGGTGVFAGATGSLVGDGTGDFTGPGSFVLSSLKGTLSTLKDGSKLTVSVNGESSLSCSTSSRILLTLHGTGNAAGVDRFAMDLRAEIGGTGCSP
jgi:hypothetical protein